MQKKLVAADSPYSLPADDLSGTLPVEDVHLEVDTTDGAITINLPKISNCAALNGRVYIVDVAGNAAAKNITVVPDGSDEGAPDRINGLTASTVISVARAAVKLEVASQNNLSDTSKAGYWFQSVTPAPIG